jgi:non-heme chloroperoxidase
MDRRALLTASIMAGAAFGAGGEAQAAPSPIAPRRPVATRDGARLFVRDWGAGEPVVFLAGWSLPSDMWAYQMAPLCDAGFRCIAYDRRGHGRSEDPGRGYDYDTLADDLGQVLDRLDLRGVTLVAHSMSGGEAVRYLSRHGKAGRVKKVLFLAPTLPFLTQTPDNPMGVPAAALDQVRNTFMADFPKWIEDNSAPFVLPQTSDPMRTWIKAMMLQTSMKAVLDCNRAMVAADFRPELARLAVPSLVIHGDKDASAPLEITGKRAAALIPGGQLKIYEGAPHGLFVTHASQLNADIEAFVRR